MRYTATATAIAALLAFSACGQSQAPEDAAAASTASQIASAPVAAPATTSIPAPALQPGLLDFYKDLHINPELSLQEVETSKKLAAELETLGFEVTTGLGDDWVKAKAKRDVGQVYEGVGGYGVVGVMKNGEGPTILLRTDTDGLPVPEQTGKPYASQASNVGWTGVDSPVMHACGHDVHMTSWLGAARNLVAQKDDWSGTLIMIAQPAEELGLGAQAMLEDGLYERFGVPDANIAMHVSASLPSGQVSYTPGYALANVDSVDITVNGVGGHGAYPHTTRDPVIVAAHIITALQTLTSRNVDPQNPAVVTVGSLHAGAKHNIISNKAELKITVRSYDDATRDLLLSGIERIAKGQAAAFGAPEPEISIEKDYTPSTYNNPELTAKVMASVAGVLGEANVIEASPVMGGEDFSQYGRTDENVPGLIFWVGAVEPSVYAASKKDGGKALPSLHSPFFAPDAERTLATGVASMTTAALAAFAGE